MQVQIGEQIRQLRVAHQLTQEELATRADLTKGFISQVERDLTSISLDSLVLILGALDTSLGEFFTEIDGEKPIVFGRDDRVQASWGGCDNLELLIPAATTRKMDPILVHLGTGDTFGCGGGHDGEELGYVLSGAIRLEVGDREFTVRAGECFYYAANQTHRVTDWKGQDASFLWIATPPRL